MNRTRLGFRRYAYISYGQESELTSIFHFSPSDYSAFFGASSSFDVNSASRICFIQAPDSVTLEARRTRVGQIFMAYECPGRIEDSSSGNFIDLVCNQTGGSSDNQVDSVDSKNRSLIPGKISEDIKWKLGISHWKSTALNSESSTCCRSLIDLPSALISEILSCLDPKELGVVSCVSTQLHRIASEHCNWKEFYFQMWGKPVVQKLCGVEGSEGSDWRELFAQREFRSKAFLGRYSVDVLHGHTEEVRAVLLLSSVKLIFTSGFDTTVRAWSMEEGLAIASSRPLGCTIRALAADTKLLIAGGTDGFIHGWKSIDHLPHLFDLNRPYNRDTEIRLWEHGGPVSCLALDISKIYSGSWDMAVRIWDRSALKCLHVLRHGDWVWNLAPHNNTVATSSGSDVYLWEIQSGQLIFFLGSVHCGKIYGLARSHTGNFVFTGGEDGAIHMLKFVNDHREPKFYRMATWVPHSGPVYSIAFEFPWLVSASCDGRLSLIDVRRLVRENYDVFKRANQIEKNEIEPPQRMLHGFACNLFSVDIGVDRIICGGEEGVVRVWNFSRALEMEKRAHVLKGLRMENRMRRRKLQLEMNKKGSNPDKCLVAAKKGSSSINGEMCNTWPGKRSGKIKA